MKFENKRVAGIASSPSMAVAMAAKKLAAEGRDIIDLSLGEPDFEPPTHVADAACEAIRKGRVRYGVPAGMESLRQAIVSKFKRENGLDYALDEVIVANGAKQILFDVFLATLEPGDEVIIPTHAGYPTATSCPCTVASRSTSTAGRTLASRSPPTGCRQRSRPRLAG